MKIKIVIFLIVVAVFFGVLAFFSNRDDILSKVEGLKRPRPIDSLTLPRPSDVSPEVNSSNPVKRELMQKEKIISQIKAGGGGAGGDFMQFQASCIAQGGNVLTDVNESNIIFECYGLSSDAGKPCRTDVDCGSYNCNLQVAIDLGVCTVTKTDKYFDNQTYIYSYICSNSKPGLCGEIPRNAPEYYWAGENVIEYGQKIFPGEEDEFQPV